MVATLFSGRDQGEPMANQQHSTMNDCICFKPKAFSWCRERKSFVWYSLHSIDISHDVFTTSNVVVNSSHDSITFSMSVDVTPGHRKTLSIWVIKTMQWVRPTWKTRKGGGSRATKRHLNHFFLSWRSRRAWTWPTWNSTVVSKRSGGLQCTMCVQICPWVVKLRPATMPWSIGRKSFQVLEAKYSTGRGIGQGLF